MVEVLYISLCSTLICQYCETTFCDREDLERHVENKHSCDLFVCSKCGRTFKYKKNLNAHVRTTHSNQFVECSECQFRTVYKRALERHIMSLHMNLKHSGVKKERRIKEEYSHQCDTCQKEFCTKKRLKLHQKRMHLNIVRDGNHWRKRVYACSICHKTFSRQDGWKRHENYSHTTGYPIYECYHCSKAFKRKRTLEIHLQTCENRTESRKSTKVKLFTCLIPNCGIELGDRRLMNKHYEEKHGVQLVYENIEFETYRKFEEWLEDLQRNTASQFYVNNRWKNSTANLARLICHRSGFEPAERENRVRFPRVIGSKKLNGYCPAQIIIKEDHIQQTCVANFQKTHVGHTIGCHDELPYLNLAKKKKLDLASKLAPKMLFDASLLQLQSTSESLFEHSYRKDINYADIANVNVSEEYDSICYEPFADDAKNVLNFMFENEENILLFKNEGEVDEDYGILDKKDLAIVYMDEFQRELLQKFGNNVIAYDSIHKTNSNDFLLHSMLVLDDEWEGIAVAFLLSNRNDATIFEIFLDCIKKQVGVLAPTTVITDMQPSFHNAFEVVMGRADFFLWCMWHVYENWRLQQRKIKNEKKRRQILMFLYNLSQIPDRDIFQTKLAAFSSNPDRDLEEFMKYFNENFAEKPEYWAYCYRIGSNISINMTVESFHNDFKSKITNIKKMKTVYSCLCSIKTYLSIKKEYREVKTANFRRMEKFKILQNRHKEAKKVYRTMEIVPYDDEDCFIWLITFPKAKKKNQEKTETEEKIHKTNVIDDDVNEKKYFINVAENSNIEDNEDDEGSDNYDDVKLNSSEIDCCELRTKIVQHRPNKPLESGGLECNKCKVFLEEYSCTCNDYLIRGNMCRHIHAVAMYRKENSSSIVSIIPEAKVLNNDEIMDHDVCYIEEKFVDIEDDSTSDIEDYRAVLVDEISKMKSKESLKKLSKLLFSSGSPVCEEKTELKALFPNNHLL